MRFFLLILVVFNISCAPKGEEAQEIKKQSELNLDRKNLPTSFDHCRLRAINIEQPNYINVCKTSIGDLALDDYLRSLDSGLKSSTELKIIDETEFLPEEDYPSRTAEIDPAQLSKSLRRINELGRISDSKQGSGSKKHEYSSNSINEQIRRINEARDRLEQERELNSRLDPVYQLRNHLRSSDPVKRVGIISLMEAQSSKKEFKEEYGKRHKALKEKLRLVGDEEIKSYKLVGSSAQTFLRSEKEYELGDKEFASEILSLSESLLDVGIGLVPGSKLVKNTFEVIFGFNIVTGEELSIEERGFSLVAASSEIN